MKKELSERMNFVKASKQTVMKNDEKNMFFGTLLHIGIFLFGVALSFVPILNNKLPFGTALVGGVKQKYISASCLGAGVGYFINPSGGFIYIASLFAVTAIRLILGNKNRLFCSPAFCAVLTFFTVGIISLVSVLGYSVSIIPLVAEAALSAVTAYFIATAGRIHFESTSGLDISEMVSVCFLISLLIMSLYPLMPIGLSVGRVLATAVILFAARYGRTAYGAVAGTIISFTIIISASQSIKSSAIFAFCGLFSGLFSGLGSIGIVIAYLSSNLLSSLITESYELLTPLFFEAVIGSGIFFLIPGKLGRMIGGVMAPPPELTRMDSVRNSLIMRLEFAGGALRDVYETVEDVADKLTDINSPDFEKTLRKIEEETCVGCSLRKHCWETSKELTANDAISKWNRLKFPDLQEGKSSHNCLREDKFTAAIGHHCGEYDLKKSAERRLREIRGAINDQFEGISNMLFDLSEEFKYEVRHDPVAAENIILCMKNLGFHAIRCIAARDKFGRLSADIHIKGVADRVVNKMEVMRTLSLSLGLDMDTPSVSTGGDEAFIFITEKPVYKIELGISQIPESKDKLCGDTVKCFNDGRGRYILLLSDGMGSGGRAAVDSAMVSGLMSRMIRSGFGYDCALKIVNSSMLFKSTDESLSTVDISAIDLFTGETELLKAGAAPTFVRRSGRVGKAESNALPPGILRDVALDKAKVNLKAEDILVMVSDGATAEDDDWICTVIADWTLGSAQQLADEIAFGARRRRQDGHSDDISVMVAILKKPE